MKYKTSKSNSCYGCIIVYCDCGTNGEWQELWLNSAWKVCSSTFSVLLRWTTGRDKGAYLHRTWALCDPHKSWQVPWCLHSAAAAWLRCSWLRLWLNSIKNVCPTIGSVLLRWTTGRDEGAYLHRKWALCDPHTSCTRYSLHIVEILQ